MSNTMQEHQKTLEMAEQALAQAEEAEAEEVKRLDDARQELARIEAKIRGTDPGDKAIASLASSKLQAEARISALRARVELRAGEREAAAAIIRPARLALTRAELDTKLAEVAKQEQDLAQFFDRFFREAHRALGTHDETWSAARALATRLGVNGPQGTAWLEAAAQSRAGGSTREMLHAIGRGLENITNRKQVQREHREYIEACQRHAVGLASVEVQTSALDATPSPSAIAIANAIDTKRTRDEARSTEEG